MKVFVEKVFIRKGGYRVANLVVKENPFPFEVTRLEVEFAPSKEAEVMFQTGKTLDIEIRYPHEG